VLTPAPAVRGARGGTCLRPREPGAACALRRSARGSRSPAARRLLAAPLAGRGTRSWAAGDVLVALRERGGQAAAVASAARG